MLHSISGYLDTGISYDVRLKIVNLLSVSLSNHYIVFTKCFQFHWNVKGISFGPFHNLFEEGYTLFYKSIDSIAERIVQLGFLSIGSLEEFRKTGTIAETLSGNILLEDMIKIMRDDNIKLIKEIRNIIELTGTTLFDPATNNMMTDLIEATEKYLWKVQSHIL